MGTTTDINPTPLDMTGWQTVFFDGFNGTAIDRGKWAITYGGGNLYWNGAFRWENDMLSVGDGALTIGMEREADGIWSVGGLSTASYQGMPAGTGHGFLYGRVEIRAKTSAEVEGAGPCFLLWPTSNDRWPPEIDILETPKGGQGMFTVHWPGPDGSENGRGYKSEFFDLDHSQWHTYTLDWLPDRMTLYVDGRKVGEIRDNIPDIPMSVGLQGHVGRADDGWYGSPNGSGVDRVDIDVDWVRVSQLTGGTTPPATPPAPPATPPAPRTPATLTAGTGPDTLVLRLSQDAWAGDAQYTVAVDGVRIGGTFTAAALRGAGADTLTLRGDWAPGAHKLTLTFLNDGWGGSAATDRNLYLEGATYNGVAVAEAGRSLMVAGPVELGFTEPAPATPPAAPAGLRLDGTSGHDTLTGAGRADRLSGGDGNDALSGLGGADTLIGGAGHDTLRGGTGNDLMQGGDGNDFFRGATGNDTITTGAGRDTIRIQAGDGHDRVTDFTPGTDRLQLPGVETAELRAAAATEGGVAGLKLTLPGGETLFLAGVAATTTAAQLGLAGSFAASPATQAPAPPAPNLVAGTAGDDWLKGGAGHDSLAGGAGSDDLQGGAGDDWLRGGTGHDGLVGGAGADRFLFARGDGADWIEDFAMGQDRVVLEGIAAGQVAQRVETRWGYAGVALDLGQGDEIFVAGATRPLGAAELVFA